MKKFVKEYQKKSVADLEKEVRTIRERLAKARLEGKSAPQKDSNIISKDKKRLAVVLTLLAQVRHEKQNA